MSRFFFGLAKLSPVSSDVLAHKRRSFRLFSSSLATTTPYLSLGDTLKKHSPDDGTETRDVVFFDPVKEERLTITDKTFPQELVHSRQIGSSHGWGIFSRDGERSVCMSNVYHPLSPKSNPEIIPLPSLTALPDNQTGVVWNVAMSSSSPSDDDEDCVVAIKFLGNQLSLCRPNRDLRWTNVETLGMLETSNLMYSNRDQRFYLPAPGGNELYSWDLNLDKKNLSPELHQVVFRDLPELAESEWGLLDMLCSRTEHLVESASTGECFLVKCYAQGYPWSEKFKYMIRRFMVFREEETTQGRYMCYTEDIGDVCIFLSKSEAFCVQATSCPGLQPNSIYFIGKGFGIYSLADNKTTHSFKVPSSSGLYWLPPSCI
ncbi:hypothetical protein Bca4012_076847 [Brassica carinata]|uniref:KIB1-4 beta-propeller domain-containing protein n=1 Tax=Brassica carinata TaxID=52824 RepID=A0A8X7Q9K9_BRACI|nr:hypothetical protein Bca52824_072887 [Brassica carinata]